jgi:uncharacterized protein YfaP (DUF2135 family)
MVRLPAVLMALAACHGPDDLRVELSWSGPSADLDLHVLSNPAAEVWDVQDDMHFCVLDDPPDWGRPGPKGDPRSEIDDRGGYGPEVIAVRDPDAEVYPLLVHYYSRGGAGQVETATVRVWAGDTLVHEAEQDIDYNQVWEVGMFVPADGTVIPSDEPLTDSSRRQCIED